MSRRIESQRDQWPFRATGAWEPDFTEDPRHTDYDHLEQMADVNEGYESGMHDRTPPSHSDLAEEDFERRRRQQYPRGFGPPLHGEDDPHDMDPEGASLDDHDPDRYLPDDLVMGEDEFDHHDDPDHMRDYRHAWRLATEYELDMKAEHPQLAVRNDDVKIMHVPEEDGPGYRAIVRRSPVGNGWDVLHPLKNDSTYLSDETAASGWPQKRQAAEADPREAVWTQLGYALNQGNARGRASAKTKAVRMLQDLYGEKFDPKRSLESYHDELDKQVGFQSYPPDWYE